MAGFPRAAGREPNRVMITGTVMLATIMQVLDTTIANVALPHMQGSLGATQDQITWVLTSYIIAAAIATPATGWLAGRFGRTRLFIVSLVGFIFASTLCGVAGSLTQMVLFRLLQGLFGAALVPLSQAILLDSYARAETGKAMGIFSMGVMVGPILGPIVGGYLTEDYSWRWCFYINVPLGIVAILGAIAFIPEARKKIGQKLDWFGFAFLGLAIASFQLILDRGELKGWFQSPEILTEASLAIFGLYMFVAHSATTERPFFDVRLFKDRTFVASTFIMAFLMIVYYGSMSLTPQMLQGEMNYPVLTAGLVMAPRGVGTILAILLVGRISSFVGQRTIIACGLIVSAAAMYLMSRWTLEVPGRQVMLVGALQGAAVGFINVPLATIAFATLDKDLRTEGSGLYSLMRNIGSAAGVSITAAQLSQYIQINHGYLSEFMTQFRNMPLAAGVTRTMNLELLNLDLTRQAAMIAYINVFWLLGLLSLAVIPLVFILRGQKRETGGEPVVVGE